MLEYILLIGDVNQNFPIPAFTIPSINEPGDYDVTDYPYTFFHDDENSNEYDSFNPSAFIGRLCIQDFTDFYNLKSFHPKFFCNLFCFSNSFFFLLFFDLQ